MLITDVAKNVFTCKEIAIFNRVVKLVESIDEHKFPSKKINSHELAIAVADVMNLQVKHGFFYKSGAYHSWVELSKIVIIDVYCLERLPPVQLISIDPSKPKQYLYVDWRQQPITPIQLFNVDLDLVDQLVKSIRNVPHSFGWNKK